MTGIYCIENQINHKKYFGSSLKMKSRLQQHKSQLKCNRHYNIHLQNSYNKYGKKNFEFRIIEIGLFNNYELAVKENWYIKGNNTMNYNKGYNLCLVDINNRISLPTIETKRKISRIVTERTIGNFNKIRAIHLYKNQILDFNSIYEVGEYIKNNNLAKGSLNSIKRYISDALSNIKVSKPNNRIITITEAYKFKWLYV